MTTTIQTLQSLATSGLLVATEHGVYRPHDGVTEHAHCPLTGYCWDGAVSEDPMPEECTSLLCDVALHDSATNAELTEDDLGVDALDYHSGCVASLATPEAEQGHIRVAGRTVYAA